jgi:hypothetical protein
VTELFLGVSIRPGPSPKLSASRRDLAVAAHERFRVMLGSRGTAIRINGEPMQRHLWISFMAVLAGCASSTGILPAGPDSYTISEKVAPIRGGGTEAQRNALTEANAFCAEKGRQFVPNMMDQSGSLTNPYGPTGYSVTFRCLLPNDPAVAKFHLERGPNFIVEQRNR